MYNMSIISNMIIIMKQNIVCLMLIFNVTMLFSQNVCEVTAYDSIVVPQIMSNEVKYFQCNFVEDKMMLSLNESFVSEGIIKYTPTEIIIEYTKPERIIIKKDANNNITVSNNNIIIKANAFHKQTITFIENIFKGGIDNMTKNYSVTTIDDSTQFIVEMTAKKKSRIRSMELYLDKSDNNAINRIIVKETKGNVITITFSERNVKM